MTSVVRIKHPQSGDSVYQIVGQEDRGYFLSMKDVLRALGKTGANTKSKRAGGNVLV